jgi:peptide chain release factor 1
MNYQSIYNWLSVKNRLDEIDLSLSDPRIDPTNAVSLRKESGFLTEVYNIYLDLEQENNNLSNLQNNISENFNDLELQSLYKEEIIELQNNIKNKISQLESCLYPPDKEQQRSIFLEIRAGTGGLEASLFASEIARTYTLYSQKCGWEATVTDFTETGIGGYKEIILHIEGYNVFERLRFEAGVHRVQRVPETEGSGRVHTSTITIAILPEAEEVEVNIDPKDLKIDTYRAGGAGGQHVNKTDSAVRMTHIPSGLVVACQDERSQHKNRARALKVLKARLYALEKEKYNSKISKLRKEMVSSGDRSEKVRTYNYPQNRVTDHQVQITINRLEFFMEGDMDEIINPLVEKGKLERRINSFFSTFVL